MAPQFLKAITVATGLLATLAQAVPVQRRALVTEVVVKKVTITTTVTGHPGPDYTIPPAPAATQSKANDAVFVAKPSPKAAAASPPRPRPVQPSVLPTPAPPKPSVPATPSPQPPKPTPAAPPPPVQPPPAPPAAKKPVQPATQAPPTGSSGGSSAPSGQYSGDLTFYDSGMTSCGVPFTSESDDVVALPRDYMAASNPGNPNNNPHCGKTVTITYNGKTATGKALDTCEGCNGDSIDLSHHLFQALGLTESQGRVHGATWSIA